MCFLIINLTNNVIPITRTTLEKVELLPHKPFLLETMHNPEINFWRNCTDIRFKIMSEATEIDRYLKVLENQAKNNTATETVKVTDNKVEPEEVPVVTDVSLSNKEVKVEETPTLTTYTEEELVGMKVTELKNIAQQLNIKLTNNVNKATIIQTILDNQ